MNTYTYVASAFPNEEKGCPRDTLPRRRTQRKRAHEQNETKYHPVPNLLGSVREKRDWEQ